MSLLGVWLIGETFIFISCVVCMRGSDLLSLSLIGWQGAHKASKLNTPNSNSMLVNFVAASFPPVHTMPFLFPACDQKLNIFVTSQSV